MLVDQTLDPSTLHAPMHSTSIAWVMLARVGPCIRPFYDKCQRLLLLILLRPLHFWCSVCEIEMEEFLSFEEVV